jgi:hypothetical protein
MILLILGRHLTLVARSRHQAKSLPARPAPTFRTASISLLACAALLTFLNPALRADLLWEADVSRGTSVFGGLEKAPGEINIVTDPLGHYGKVYQFKTWDDKSYRKERCEARGTVTPSGVFRLVEGKEYYIGWRAMWDPMPINPGWVALFQMHGYGPPGQGAPLVLRCIKGDGNMYMQNNANGVDTDFWQSPFKSGVWQTFVVHVLLSSDPAKGYTEIWYNGAPQTFINKQTRWYGPTWDAPAGSFNQLKWGVYRSGAMNGKGPATAYMSDAKVGTTYADVDPNPPSPSSDTNL